MGRREQVLKKKEEEEREKIHTHYSLPNSIISLFMQVIGKMPRMRHTHYKHTLFKFNNPIFCLKMFLRTKRQENTSKTYQKVFSLSPYRSLEWKGFQSSSSPGPSFSAQRYYVTRPKIKDFWETHNDLEPQSTGQFNCLSPEFSWFFNDKLPIIHTIWLSHNSQECHSELFHGGALPSQLCAIFKCEIAFCSDHMSKHGKFKIQKLAVSIQIYWDKRQRVLGMPKEAYPYFWMKTLRRKPEDYVLNCSRQWHEKIGIKHWNYIYQGQFLKGEV